MSSWWTIGKYTMMLNLGKIYRKRKIFLPLFGMIYLLYAIGLKILIDTNPDNAIVNLISNKALFATLLDLVMLYLFVYLIIIHVFTGIRRQNKSSIELLLSAPIQSADIVLGETIAMLPIYLLIAPIVIIPLLVTGFFLAGVGIFGIIKLFLSQALLVLLAVGVGAIALTLIQSSIQRTKSSKYFRLISSGLSAGLYLSIYFLRSWLTTAEAVTQNWAFSLLPTSLTGNIAFSEISGYIPDPSIALSFLLLVVWVCLVYALGIRIAGKAFSLEKELSVAKASISKEGFLFKIVRKITPARYVEKVTTHFKIYFRDEHNSSTSIYLIIISYFMPIAFVWSSRSEPETFKYLFMVGIYMIPMFVTISMISLFYLSRNALWIWKKAPNGTNDFINSKWIQSFILSLIYLPVPLIIGIVVGFDIVGISRVLFTTLLLLSVNAFAISFSILLNVLSPTKRETGAKVGINSIFSTMGLFILLLAITIPLESMVSYYVFVPIFGLLINIIGYFMIKVAKSRIADAMDI